MERLLLFLLLLQTFELSAQKTKQFHEKAFVIDTHNDVLLNQMVSGVDFEGAESYPLEMDGVQDYPKITAALLRLKYPEKDIHKILGGNLLRVLKVNTGK
ncbi:microsomal dipeptidase-like Zn-dependent dipeptidase [Pedobacter sp. CG_S7]|uniref:membrane dipeptidase n=1 Tax=Pedobacter sp. CG_S7 TaxID=3143930 RepID=UPI0033944D7D